MPPKTAYYIYLVCLRELLNPGQGQSRLQIWIKGTMYGHDVVFRCHTLMWKLNILITIESLHSIMKWPGLRRGNARIFHKLEMCSFLRHHWTVNTTERHSPQTAFTRTQTTLTQLDASKVQRSLFSFKAEAVRRIKQTKPKQSSTAKIWGWYREIWCWNTK